MVPVCVFLFLMLASPRRRRYRAPEVLLGSVHYGKGVDLWGVGCVAAELMMSRPLFPGITTMNQVELILQVKHTHTGDLQAKIIIIIIIKTAVFVPRPVPRAR